MIQVFTIIAPLFLLIFIAAVLRKLFAFGKNWETSLNEFAFNVGFPALILSAFAQMTISLETGLSIVFINTIFLLSALFLAIILGKILILKKKAFLTFFLCFVFGNVAYLGMPLLSSVKGDEIIPILALVVASYLFWIFTIVVFYLEYSLHENKERLFRTVFINLFKNPLLLAVLLGLFINFFHIDLPDIIENSLKMLSVSVTPLVLIVIGLFIGRSKVGRLREWIPVLLFSIFTLFLLPAFLYFGLKLFNMSVKENMILIVEAAMPLAITPFMMADKYNLDKNFIARAIVLSTILSALSLPFWLYILG